MPDFVRLEPIHLLAIRRQPSQHVLMGVEATVSPEEADLLAGMPEAWTMMRAGVPIACFGISDLFAGRQGVCWAVLAEGLGAAHLALTRFIARRLPGLPHVRLETFARAPDVEGLAARHPGIDTGHMVALAMTRQTPEIRWACMLGFRPAHVLRRYGGHDETYMLLERVVPRIAAGERC